MDDPFGEFQQVDIEQKVAVSDVPAEVADSVPFIHVDEHEHDEAQARHSDIPLPHYELPSCSSQPPEINRKHFEQRRKFEKKEHQKLNEIHSIAERLYTIRYDRSRDMQQSIVEIKNLLAELNRLNEELSIMRERHSLIYAETLHLDDLGISKRIRTRSFRKSSSKIDFEDSHTLPSSASLAGRTVSMNELDPPSVGLMRTTSTQTLEGQSSTDKWASLFRMFKEFKHQKQVAEAQHIVADGSSSTDRQMLDEEIAKLRAAIYSLRQRKTLSEGDKQLLRVLQAKLKALKTV